VFCQKHFELTMANFYGKLTESRSTEEGDAYPVIDSSLEKLTDPAALPNPIDPMYSSLFSDTDGCQDDWFQPKYFDSSLNSNDSLTTLDNSLYSEPDILGTWRPDDTMFDSPRKNPISSPNNNPRTPSLCEDPDNPGITTDSQPLTPTEGPSIKHDSPEPQPPPKRKRGRPRLIRADSESSYGDSMSRKPRLSKRQPHNEVERKYREGLNAELERLRMAIPTLPQWDSQLLHGPPKPSKATVLASAIDYIHKMELERDRLQRENEVLRAGRGMVTGQGPKLNGRLNSYAWQRPQATVSLH